MRGLKGMILCLTALCLITCTGMPSQKATSAEATVRRLWQVCSTRDLASLSDVIDSGYVGHLSRTEQPRGIDDLRKTLLDVWKAHPTAQWIIQDMIVDGDTVVTRYALRTSVAQTADAAKEGSSVDAIAIHRVESAKVVEGWWGWETVLTRMPAGQDEDMVYVEGGTFVMGDTAGDGISDESPPHEVQVASYYMAKIEVTVGEFAQFIAETGYQTSAEEGEAPYIWLGFAWERTTGANWRYPAYDQLGVTVRADFSAGGYRLPTEAEWEYAARARGQAHRYPRGNGRPSGNIADETAREQCPEWIVCRDYTDGYVFTSPAATYEANELGIHDMAGNVWEWIWDWYGQEYCTRSRENQPRGPQAGTFRVLRGGSWADYDGYVHSTSRNGCPPETSFSNIGFRVVRTAG